jgi:FkbM family methyltransferase
VNVHDVAVSNERGKIEFNVAKKSDTSSIYNPSDAKFSLRGGLNREDRRPELYEIEEVLEVSQIPLSDIAENIDLVKLDIQGKELDALKGIKDIESVEIIISETMFLPLYENQPLFCDINNYLTDKNFQLYGLYNLYDRSTGQLEFANALFLNKRHLDEDLVLKDDLRGLD